MRFPRTCQHCLSAEKDLNPSGCNIHGPFYLLALYSVACIRKSGVHTNILSLIEIYINEVYHGLRTNTLTMHRCSRYLGPENIGMPMCNGPGANPAHFGKQTLQSPTILLCIQNR